MSKDRSSNFELLRLLCIFGILMMHTFGGIDTSVSFFNTEIHVLVNSVFNMGVTCFIPVSYTHLDVYKRHEFCLMT